MGEGWTRGASDLVKAKSFKEDPRATGGLVSNLPQTRVNKTKQHSKSMLWAIVFDSRTAPTCAIAHTPIKIAFFMAGENLFLLREKTSVQRATAQFRQWAPRRSRCVASADLGVAGCYHYLHAAWARVWQNWQEALAVGRRVSGERICYPLTARTVSEGAHLLATVNLPTAPCPHTRPAGPEPRGRGRLSL